MLKFAKCDSSNKFINSYQDNYVTVSTKEVGALCSWYETFDGDDSAFDLSEEITYIYQVINHWNRTFAQFQRMA